jgi:hypothetical protein
MNPHIRELLACLRRQPHDPFSIAGRIDERRYLARQFPGEFPLILSLQAYPAYRQMVGENWMHWHDYYELWLATDGGGVYRRGNHRFAFGPGDVVLVDPLKIPGVLRMEEGHAPLVLFFPAEAIAPAGTGIDLGFLAAWDRRPDHVLPRVEGEAAPAGAVHGALLETTGWGFGDYLRELRLERAAQFTFQGSAFEPVVAGDGRLLIVRVGSPSLPWNDPVTGVARTPQGCDIVYCYYEGGIPADPAQWTNLCPISHAPCDPRINTKFGFARAPFRDPEGTLIPDGEDIGASYPWSAPTLRTAATASASTSASSSRRRATR